MSLASIPALVTTAAHGAALFRAVRDGASADGDGLAAMPAPKRATLLVAAASAAFWVALAVVGFLDPFVFVPVATLLVLVAHGLLLVLSRRRKTTPARAVRDDAAVALAPKALEADAPADDPGAESAPASDDERRGDSRASSLEDAGDETKDEAPADRASEDRPPTPSARAADDEEKDLAPPDEPDSPSRPTSSDVSSEASSGAQ